MTAEAAPTGIFVAAAPERAIPGEYIVVLKNQPSLRATASVAQAARSLAAEHDGTVTHTYSAALKGFATAMSEDEARELARDPRVAAVHQNGKVRAMDTQNNATWGLDRIDQRNRPLSSSYTYTTTASNVSAYIIDTGILTTHSQFGGRAVSGFDAIDGGEATDCNGHGTHVAGTVGSTTYGVAKAVSLYAVRVLDCQGSGDDAGVIAGIEWVTANARKPAVANMSLGGDASPALDNAIKNSIQSGITYVVAAGNETQNACNVSPARLAEAITVGSTTSSDARSSFSNYGTCVDIFAPGSRITSTWIGSNSATQTIDGTSMAAPHVAGAAALYLAANPTASPTQVTDALLTNSTPNVVTSPGSGSPNRLLFTGASTPPNPTPSPTTPTPSPTTPTPGPPTPPPTSGPTPPTPGPPTPPPTSGPGKFFENTRDVRIPDGGRAVTSNIPVTGVAGQAPATLKVTVDIVHPYKGDLKVDLIAPDGTVYVLHNRSGGSGDNVQQTFTVDASSEVANGTWRLRARDYEFFDTGYINGWSLQF